MSTEMNSVAGKARNVGVNTWLILLGLSVLVFGGLSLAWFVALSIPIVGWAVAFLVIPVLSVVIWPMNPGAVIDADSEFPARPAGSSGRVRRWQPAGRWS